MKKELHPYPLRTLIVDNSLIFLTCLHRLLNMQGLIQVVGTASDGREAVEKAGLLTPDLVLMDLHMPGMHGLQATRLLRQQVPHSRIIIMTAAETGSIATYCLAHGAHGFVSKDKMLTTLSPEIQRLFPTS